MSELCSVPRVSERFAQSNALDEDIARLKYVSGKREEALRRLGIRTVRDLLLHIPHRYLDFTRSWSIEMAPIGTVCTIVATVDRIVQKQPRPRMQVTEVSLVDETGVLQVAFFRQPWIAQQFKQGDRLAVMGKVEFAYGFKQMASPHFEKLEDGTEIVRCRDLPELLSYSVDGEPLENWARYAVEDCVEFRIKDGELIPEASPALPGEYVVRLSANQVAKILLSNAMARDGVSRAELAKKAELKLPEVTRILDVHHPTKIDRIEATLRSLGHRLQLSIA